MAALYRRSELLDAKDKTELVATCIEETEERDAQGEQAYYVDGNRQGFPRLQRRAS